jgi:tetratricopeptide (TPR) repeat protein
LAAAVGETGLYEGSSNMLTWIVLTVALAAGPQAQTPTGQPSDPRAQAEQLARSGARREALERFQAIAAANPDDVEARVWIARLLAELGDRNRSIAVYQSIVATQPQHLDALLGLGHTLVDAGRLREAADALNRAESLAAERPAVLAEQGRLHARAGRTVLSLAYYERALSLEPTNLEVRRQYEEVVAERAHRVVFGYLLEHFNIDGLRDPQAGTAAIDGRVTETLRVSGVVQHQRKFSRSETRGGGGIEWAIRHNLRLRGGALFGGDAEILPRADGYGGLAYTRGPATWSFDVRAADFDQLRVNVVGGGLRIALPEASAAWVRYYRFATDYPAARSDIVHSWVLGAAGRVNPVWTLGLEYTRGPDRLDMLTLDQTGTFETNTISPFVDFRLTPMLSLDGRYDYQARPDEVRVHRAVIRLVHRF